MAKKMISVEAAESIKRSQIQELSGFKLGDQVWARLADGSVGTGVIETLYDSASGQSATFYDKNGSKFRTVYLADLSREEIKGRRKSQGKGAAGASVGIMKLRLKSGEDLA
jgi:hypothetical protein